MIENALDLEGLGYYHSKITEKIDTKAEQSDLDAVETLLGDADISNIGDGTVTSGINTLVANMLKAEILTTTSQFNITADTQVDFFVGLGQFIVNKGITLNETMHLRGVWANHFYVTVFCTYIPGNALIMLCFDNGGNVWIVNYNITNVSINLYYKLTSSLSSLGITATATELNYCDGVTSNIQTQLDAKAASNHTHSGIPSNGVLSLQPTTGGTEGGQLNLSAAADGTTYNGIVLDQNSGNLRIFGIASADGATKTGVGTPLVINPYSKTITGGYTLTGSLTGNASTATSASSSASNVGTSCLRNIYAGTTDLVAGSSALTTGSIYIVFE